MTFVDLRPAVRESSSHWPRLAVVAVLDALIGLLALVWPGATVLVLAVVLGVLLLASGLTSVAVGLRLRRASVGSWTWAVGLGVVSVLAAVLVLLRPGTGVAAIAAVLAVWFLVHGLADGHRARVDRGHRVWWAVLAVLNVVAGLVLLVDLGAAVLTIALIVGVSFLLRAATEFAVALQLRRVHRTLEGARY